MKAAVKVGGEFDSDGGVLLMLITLFAL